MSEGNSTDQKAAGTKGKHSVVGQEDDYIQDQLHSTSIKHGGQKSSKKKNHEDEVASQVVALFDPTSESCKKILQMILNVNSAILIKSILSRHSTLKNYIRSIDPALQYLIDSELLISYDSGCVVSSNKNRVVPVYVKRMTSPANAKENSDLSKLLKSFGIEHSDYLATWWNISLPPTITLSEEVYDLLSGAPYSTFITVPIAQWAPKSRQQASSTVCVSHTDSHIEVVQSVTPPIRLSAASTHLPEDMIPNRTIHSSDNSSTGSNADNSTDTENEKKASVAHANTSSHRQQRIPKTINDLNTGDESEMIQQENSQQSQKRSLPLEIEHQSLPLLPANINPNTKIERTTSYQYDMFTRPQQSTLFTVIEELFNLSELAFIEQVNSSFHQLTPSRCMHIANICSNTFGRLIDENSIQYILSMFQHGFLPRLNIYRNVQKIVDTYAEANQLCTLINNVIIPAAEKCCTDCGKCYSQLFSKSVSIYQFDGKISKGLICYYYCDHTGTEKFKQAPRKLYPNFIESLHGKIVSKKSLEYTDYFYIGGDSVFSKKILTQFETLLVTSHTNFQGFTEAYNLLHKYEYDTERFVERRLFSQIWIMYELVNLAFFMGYEEILLPLTMDRTQNDSFFYNIFDSLYVLFVKFWLNHSEYKSCGSYCSKALVVDGNQKLRRRICFDKTKTITTDEMTTIVVGCDRTPAYKSLYCTQHLREARSRRPTTAKYLTNNRIRASKSKNKSKFRKGNTRSQQASIEHESISCSTLKEKPEEYVKQCLRSFGFIVYVTNCNVAVAFNEIFRSETIKEILNGLINIVNISPTLPPSIIYDDACHLIRRLIDGQTRNEFCITPAINYLNRKTYNIDRLHLKNHKDTWCRKYLDPDDNPLLNNVNTESCEQLFSWSNGYAPAFTQMNQSRCRLMLLITFHLRNCYLKNINPHVFNIAKPIVTKSRPLII
ncbi:unnamed protein product [Adineta ricciae]|nr:unnamed protein product [Adineta ricciae]